MTLILTIRNAEAAAGVEPRFVVPGDSAVIGRSKNNDWTLPDDNNVISSRHCEVRREGDGFVFKDTSTNGTFLNGASERMAGERKIEAGDVFQVGHYELVASFEEVAAPPPPPPPHPPLLRDA